jgi:ABC-type polysaccharide/polyol phosphate export permease
MSIRKALAQRNLLYLLSQKELRTRYRKSILGWAWSLLNPLSQMIIFSIIFLEVFDSNPPKGAASGLENFPLYFLSGLLPFQFFSISVTAAIGNVQGGASLIKKVAFPHEHLVFSIVIAQLVTIGIELVVLSISFLFFGFFMFQWLLPMALLLVLISLFTTGVALALSAANVFFHDINYLWGITAQLMFYSSPIIFVPSQVPNEAVRFVSNWGPTGSFVRASQQILYDGQWPSIERWAYVATFSLATFAIGAWIFNKLSPRFAEEF